MFRIRKEQMEAFDQAARVAFEDEMVVHSQDFSPRLCKVMGEDQLRVAIRGAMSRADKYGFTLRGPVRLCIELMFLYGSSFDTDPQYPVIGEVLTSTRNQMHRAEQIHQRVNDYHKRVAGDENINVRKSLEYLSKFAQKNVRFSSSDFEAEVIEQMTNAFPQKVEYVGNEALIALIREGRHEAGRFGLTELRSEALLVVLMFSFGHGCTDDPLYPWISGTLNDKRIVALEDRAKRLERKAVTWLKRVLANADKELSRDR